MVLSGTDADVPADVEGELRMGNGNESDPAGGMTVEVLDKSRWDELGTIPGDVVPVPPCSRSTAVVVRDEQGQIAARVYLVFPVTAIGIWVREDKRGGVTAARLWQKVEELVRDAGMRQLLACIKPGDVLEGYAERVGFRRAVWNHWLREINQ